MSHLSFLNFHGMSKKPSLKPAQSKTYRERQGSTNISKTFNPHVEEMKRVFDKFDTNKDGKISRKEYKSAVRALGKEEAEMAKEFEALDADGNGSIDFKEFMEMMNNMGGGVSTSDIRSAFRVFDLDGSGKISAEELMQVLKMMGERSSLDACRKMIRGVDRDGDGLVDMDHGNDDWNHEIVLDYFSECSSSFQYRLNDVKISTWSFSIFILFNCLVIFHLA